jgi:hypothetical protein
MAKSTVKVEQPSGEITVTYDGWDRVTYQVTDHKVEVESRRLAKFLASNPGSKEAGRNSTKPSMEGK